MSEPDCGVNNDLVRQIVWNLLLNALEASPPASRVRITACRESSGTIRLAVCDQGPGIPEHLRESVFEPFFTTKTKGSGLGLAIVRKGARILRGDVRIECPAGGGTEIIVVLPEDRT